MIHQGLTCNGSCGFSFVLEPVQGCIDSDKGLAHRLEQTTLILHWGRRSLALTATYGDDEAACSCVDGETRRELLGHSGKDVHETVYLRPSLPVLHQHLENL